MLRLLIEIKNCVDDPQGVKEKLATDLECFGDVRVVEVIQIEPEQVRMEGI